MISNNIHTESTFESAIDRHLTSNGWHPGNASDFNCDLVFDKKDFVETGLKAVSTRRTIK
jgi:hypothetical protein